MPSGYRTTPGPPMRKWCEDCQEFKPNPNRRVKPKYCDECRKARWIKSIKKRDSNEKNL